MKVVELAEASHVIQAEYGLKSLYAPDVAELVHHVAQDMTLRTAVKQGFQERIRAVRDAGDHELLVVDRRHQDQIRDNDAVRIDKDAIDYWKDPTNSGPSIQRVGGILKRRLGTACEHTKSHLRISVGSLAKHLGRQIYFSIDFRDDYPEDPVSPMLEAADILLDESLSTKPVPAKTIL